MVIIICMGWHSQAHSHTDIKFAQPNTQPGGQADILRVFELVMMSTKSMSTVNSKTILEGTRKLSIFTFSTRGHTRLWLWIKRWPNVKNKTAENRRRRIKAKTTTATQSYTKLTSTTTASNDIKLNCTAFEWIIVVVIVAMVCAVCWLLIWFHVIVIFKNTYKYLCACL